MPQKELAVERSDGGMRIRLSGWAQQAVAQLTDVCRAKHRGMRFDSVVLNLLYWAQCQPPATQRWVCAAGLQRMFGMHERLHSWPRADLVPVRSTPEETALSDIMTLLSALPAGKIRELQEQVADMLLSEAEVGPAE